ncbi:MAG: hypothetical protein LBF90_02820 [Prevotellaceae bacterium]|jgi:hypothetical protein|nr:hypothetical protein [Prevotellaceae bacterium]
MTAADVLTLPVSPEIVAKTSANVIRKYLFTNPSLMYGRTPVGLLDNLYMGDLAKNALLSQLRSQCIQPIIDYDEVRDDQFHWPDPGWDFKAGRQGLKIEVKSSIPPHGENRESLVRQRDIKITASLDNGQSWIQPADIESDIHVQIYFYAKPYQRGYETFETLQKILLDDPSQLHQIIHSQKYDRPLFFGWNTKTKLVEYSQTLNPPTWTFERTSRIYWRCPLSAARTLAELVALIDAS